MRKVSVIGIGCTQFGKQNGVGIVDLAVQACGEALSDARVPRGCIDAFYLGNFVSETLAHQGSLAPIVAHRLGLGPIPCTKVEGACASSGIAFRHGVLLIASGLCDIVLVAGVEKMTSAETGAVTEALASAGDADSEMRLGLTFPGTFGIVMRRHMHQYGTTREQVAMVSVKNRSNGSANPRAHFQKCVTMGEILESRLICDPLRLYDCTPISDGAAAAVLCAADLASALTGRPVDVIGSGHATGPATLFEMADLTTFEASVAAGQQAYREAGVAPSDIDVAEVHDCFTIAEIAAIEDLGFVKKGKGGTAIADGLTALDGRLPTNPSGGLLSKGHPVGATGLAQIYEIVLQLRGEAVNQVKGAEIGLAHNLGGTGAVSTVHILRRR
ncbi:acetyl-CoA acetyltransferase [Candidatus Methylomirabilis lanthanidiphila]|uniref:propanoyl-CoA C-acyltransferase n=1 Tax=Candidatus Methylomirabilis lanthanidiphila TaxID=2211376 RepID=A0A564ZN42_9BACT|nr:thiolase domain-containing protein [Candidatus Methylomirabilis lanthanidiphila]VUZ86516.1 acetyl-CoA acetyltransferase [Candidatus Methylomirabilis lanthanidiphila]